MQQLTTATGLSEYCLTVLHDFCPHSFVASEGKKTAGKQTKQQLQDVICNNPHIRVMHKDATTRRLAVAKREEELALELKRGHITAQAKDYTLVHELVACGHTTNGHFVYCYYVGPERRSKDDMAQLQHWMLVDKKHLSLFHKRLGRDVAQCYQYTSTQVTETRDGRRNLELDMRYVVQKWLASQQGEKAAPALRGQGDLFAPGQDYLVSKHVQQTPTPEPVAKPPTPSKALVVVSPKPSVNTLTVTPPTAITVNTCTDMVLCEPAQSDPYEVCDEEYSHISDAEYDRVCAMPVPDDMRFSFRQFMDVSRRCALRTQQLAPDYYDHDPVHLFDALVLALNGELHSQGTMETVMKQHLLVIENDNVAQLLEAMSLDAQVSQDIKTRAEEYVWALMAVENATRNVPASLKEHFPVVEATTHENAQSSL